MSAATIAYAIAAAFLMAIGSALQHHAVTGKRASRNGLQLLWRLARNPRWMTGLAVLTVGTLLHAAALSSGALAVVQPILVLAVALALPVRALLEHARPSAGQVLAAVALAAGVAVFVTSARPGTGQPVPDAGSAALLIAAGVTVAGLCAATAARAGSGRVAGFALGLAAGTLYGLGGGVLKATVHTALQNPAAAIAGWPLWALAGLGTWALILHQRAYTHGPLRVSLPVLSVANPIAGMIFGILVFGEVPGSGPLALAGEVAGMAVIVVSVAVLGRSPEPAGRHRAAAGREPAAASTGPAGRVDS